MKRTLLGSRIAGVRCSRVVHLATRCQTRRLDSPAVHAARASPLGLNARADTVSVASPPSVWLSGLQISPSQDQLRS